MKLKRRQILVQIISFTIERGILRLTIDYAHCSALHCKKYNEHIMYIFACVRKKQKFTIGRYLLYAFK